MSQFFFRNGDYFETVTDISEWPDDGRVEVPQRPSAEYTWDGTQWVYSPLPITSEQINEERDRRTLAGTTFDITGYGQIRIEGDTVTREFLEARGVAAQLVVLSGGSKTFTWRDADNVNHTLTAAQMAELYQLGGSYVEAVRSASWSLKDGGTIPLDYTDDKYWP